MFESSIDDFICARATVTINGTLVINLSSPIAIPGAVTELPEKFPRSTLIYYFQIEPFSLNEGENSDG